MEKEASFSDYIAIFMRRKWHFLLPFIIVVSLSCIFTLMLPKVYLSHATILIRKRGSKSANRLFDLSGGINKSRFAAIKTVAKSRSRIEEIIKILKLDKGISNPQEYDRLVDKIQQGLTIRASGRNIFNIFYYGSNPRLAMQIVNTVCGFFVEQEPETLYTSDDESFAVLNELLRYYEEKVNKARGVLTKFEIEYQGQMPGSLNENFAQLEKYQIELANLELKLKEAQDKKNKIEKQLSGEIEDSLETIMDDEENLTPLEKELKSLNAKLDSLLVLYTPKHPLVIKTMNEIETVKRKLIESYRKEEDGQDMEEAINVRKMAQNPAYLKLRNYLNQVNEEIQSLLSQQEAIKKQIAEYEKRVKNAPRSEQEYAMLQRDFSVNQNIYQSLLARLEEAKIEREFRMMEQGNKFEVITPAQLPLRPVSPKMSKNIIVGSILGIIFGACVVFWAEYTDHSIRDLDDVQATLKIPVLATVPTVLTEAEIINKRRLNMFLFVMGSFYTIFIVLLIIRELILAYVPSLLYLQTYKDLFYRLMELVRVV
jgi:polysaccharide chain length determinant protein (PEP-CTERM system associated)